MQDWSGFVTVIVGFGVVLVSVVGLIFTASANRRAQYDRVLDVTSLLISGDTVESRHAVSVKFEAPSSTPPSDSKKLTAHLTDEEVRALFNVLWTFERINGLFVSLQPFWPGFRATNAQKLLLEVSAAAITVWSTYIQFDIQDTGGNRIDLVPSKNGLVNLAENLQIYQSHRKPRSVLG